MIRLRNRLEKVFQKLEDQVFNQRVYAGPGHPVTALLPTHGTMREAILTGEPRTIMSMCEKLRIALVAAEETGDVPLKSSVHFIWSTFCCIATWHTQSQRVYAPSADLVELLLNTQIPDFPAGEIEFVAYAFAVQLPQAIQMPGSELKHDFLYCARDPNSPDLVVSSFSAVYDKYTPLTLEELRRYSTSTMTGRTKALQVMGRKMFASDPNADAFSYRIDPLPEQPYWEAIRQHSTQSELPDIELLYKLTLGLNLYLQTSKKIEVRNDTEQQRGPRGAMITNGLSLFELRVSTSLASQPGDEKEDGGRSMPYHFRHGHWRRPRGTGKDPNAPKTEWVEPCWVREDRRGETPHSGTERVIKIA